MKKSGMSQKKAEQKLVNAFRRYQEYRKFVGKEDTSIETALFRFVDLAGRNVFFNPKWKEVLNG